MTKSFPFYRQHDRFDCGPTCLRMIAKFYGRNYNLEHLRHLCNISVEGVSARGMIEAAEAIGLHALPVTIDYDTLVNEAPLPAIVYWRERHYVILHKVKNGTLHIVDPSFGALTHDKKTFIQAWQNRKDDEVDKKGFVILLEPTPDFYKGQEDDYDEKGLRTVLPYLRNYRTYIWQLFLGLIIGSVIQFILPFLTQALVDKGINYRDIDFIYVILLAQIMLFLSTSFLSIIQGWLLLYMGSRINILIASDYLSKLLSKTLSFFDAKTPGDILQRINDSSRIEAFLTTAPGTIFSYFNASVFLFVLFYYSPTIFTVFVAGIVLYIVWVWFFMKKRAELDFKRFEENAGTTSTLMQIVNGIQEIKVNNSEKRRLWFWEEIRIRLYKTAVSSLKLAQVQNVGASSINELKNILVTFIAAKSVIDGHISLGMMLAIQYIVGQINTPLTNLIQFFRVVQDAKLSLDRFNDIDFVTDEEKTLNNQNLRNVKPKVDDVVIKNLNFRYGGARSPFVLKDINLHIPKGKVTAIVGMSGSGKTTLLKLLLKLYLPTEGKIMVGNSDLKHINTTRWRDLCGTVMQNGYIFSDTIARNITESKSMEYLDEDRLVKAVQVANIEDFIEGHPAGYNSRIGPPGASGRSLSGGQAQRILIARAVYKNPYFIFFDEATSALDANNEKIIMDNLQSFFEGKTVVVIAHRLSTVKNADQIVVLEQGAIAEKGTHEELIKANGPYYKLVKNQLEVGK